MNDSTKWQVVGSVKDKFVSPKGGFAKVVVETSINGRRANHQIKTFDADVIRQIENVGAGEFVMVNGYLGSEMLKDKTGTPVQVDGRNIWTVMLVGESVEPAHGNADRNDRRPPTHSAPTKAAPRKPIEDDDIPFD